MKNVGTFLTACAVAAVLIVGCAKGGSQAGSEAKGPITDTASNGLKQPPAAAGAKGDPVHGKEIFGQNCASCHGANAQGGMGPNLHGEKKRKDYQQTIAWIKNPQPPMTKLYPSPLSDGDVSDVAAYVQTL